MPFFSDITLHKNACRITNFARYLHSHHRDDEQLDNYSAGTKYHRFKSLIVSKLSKKKPSFSTFFYFQYPFRQVTTCTQCAKRACWRSRARTASFKVQAIRTIRDTEWTSSVLPKYTFQRAVLLTCGSRTFRSRSDRSNACKWIA